MNPANFVPLRARLAQGDVVRVPTGGFVREQHLSDPSVLDEPGPPIAAGDRRGLATRLPRLVVAGAPLVLRAFDMLAVVVSPDCAIDKENASMLLAAPLLPLDAVPEGQRHGIRAGTYLGAFDLPGDDALRTPDDEEVPLAPSFVDLNWTTPLHKDVLLAERIVSLSAVHVDRLQGAWLRYIALRELSSVGTLASVVGKTVAAVETIQSSNRRHTAMLTFTDDSVLVVYQEPKQKGDWVESVHIHRGAFERASIEARTQSRLVIRFENDDERTWKVDCPDLGIAPRELPGGKTTHLELACPDQPRDARLRLVGTNAVLPLRVLAR